MSHLRKESSFGVLGGGFGMYGWLPAIARFSSKPIVTLKRYERIFDERNELSTYRSRTQFVADRDAILSGADVVVCAKRPIDQVEFVDHANSFGWKGHFILEKPLATDPNTAIRLIQAIESSGSGLTMGFTIGATPWAQQISKLIADSRVDEVRLLWSFQAHHFRNSTNTWKRDPVLGGGALRFYGIHLIAVLSVLEGWEVKHPISIDAEHRRFGMTLSNPGMTVQINCDSDASLAQFQCAAWKNKQGVMFVAGQDPFAIPDDSEKSGSPNDELSPGEDPRILVLIKLLQAAEQRSNQIEPLAKSHLSLWKEIEKAIGVRCQATDF